MQSPRPQTTPHRHRNHQRPHQPAHHANAGSAFRIRHHCNSTGSRGSARDLVSLPRTSPRQARLHPLRADESEHHGGDRFCLGDVARACERDGDQTITHAGDPGRVLCHVGSCPQPTGPDERNGNGAATRRRSGRVTRAVRFQQRDAVRSGIHVVAALVDERRSHWWGGRRCVWAIAQL